MANTDFIDLSGVRTDCTAIVQRHPYEVLRVEATYVGTRNDQNAYRNNGHKHGWRKRTIKDEPRGNRPVEIVLKVPRKIRPGKGKRSSSNKVESEMLNFIQPGTYMTKRLWAFIYVELSHDSIARIARRTGCSEGTVRKVFEARKKDLREQGQFAGVVVAFDGVNLGRRNNTERHTAVSDRHTGDLIGLEKHYNKETVKKCLMNLDGIQNTEIFCVDMSKTNRSAIRDLKYEGIIKSDALIIVDKRHVLDLARMIANDALDVVWKTKPRQSLCTKHVARQLINKRKKDLSPGEEELLRELSSISPVLGDAYRYKELFYQIYDTSKNRNSRLAIADYAEWVKGAKDSRCAKQFSKMIKTIKSWEQEIFVYFDMPILYTNAIAESMNNKVKQLYARSRGYKKRGRRINENFQAKAFMEFGRTRNTQVSEVLANLAA